MKKSLFLKSALVLFSSLFILASHLLANDSSGNNTRIISAEEASELIDENKNNPDFIILDVRTIDEFKSGHISDALNIDYKSTDFKLDLSKLDKDKTYITYCRSGRRSTGASEVMEEIGFENIYMIGGGITAWEKSGLPTVK